MMKLELAQFIDAKNDKHIWVTDVLEDKYGLK